MSTISIDQVARVCHEANVAYCAVIGDFVQLDWDNETDELRASIIAGVQAIVDNPDMTAEGSHEKWMDYKKVEGWGYGAVKDVDKKLHPNLLPWDQLLDDQKLKDALFQAVARTLLP